ncbi:MAG: hypothetical protein V4754_14130 [Pseudomonadota bacterium]
MKNNKEIMLSRVDGPGFVLFDRAFGDVLACGDTDCRKTRGNMHSVGGHTFALYADEGQLYFQWGGRRWNMRDPDVKIRYRHDVDAKSSVFSVNDTSLAYPAWWRDDPAFNPNIPECDEDEDYLAYIFSVKNNLELQKTLRRTWDDSAHAGTPA